MNIFDILKTPPPAETEDQKKVRIKAEKHENRTLADDGPGLFDLLKDVTNEKKYLFTEHTDYNSFMMNRYLSADLTTLFLAQDMNERSGLAKQMQHDYYFYAIKKKYRYLKYIKNDDASPQIKAIRKKYQCSISVAKEYLKIVSPEYVQGLIKFYDTWEGGPKGEAKLKSNK